MAELFLDLEGDSVIIADNPDNTNFQDKSFNDLQKLTNTTLALNDIGQVENYNDVSEDELGNVIDVGSAPTNLLPVGTSVVTSAIDAPFNNTIDNITDPNLGNSNQTEWPNGPDPTSGSGTSFTIHYNPDYTGTDNIPVPTGIVPAIQNADGTTGRPGYIGLGHELVHGEHINQGTVDKNKSSVFNPDSKSGQKEPMTNEEINTRKVDSQIRKEQGVPERAQPQP